MDMNFFPITSDAIQPITDYLSNMNGPEQVFREEGGQMYLTEEALNYLISTGQSVFGSSDLALLTPVVIGIDMGPSLPEELENKIDQIWTALYETVIPALEALGLSNDSIEQLSQSLDLELDEVRQLGTDSVAVVNEAKTSIEQKVDGMEDSMAVMASNILDIAEVQAINKALIEITNGDASWTKAKMLELLKRYLRSTNDFWAQFEKIKDDINEVKESVDELDIQPEEEEPESPTS